jgi:hypothetical protein
MPSTVLTILMSFNVTRKDQHNNRIPLNLSMALCFQPWGLFVSVAMRSRFVKDALGQAFILEVFSGQACAVWKVKDKKHSGIAEGADFGTI